MLKLAVKYKAGCLLVEATRTWWNPCVQCVAVRREESIIAYLGGESDAIVRQETYAAYLHSMLDGRTVLRTTIALFSQCIDVLKIGWMTAPRWYVSEPSRSGVQSPTSLLSA